jgi:predicted O-methyltransferase YrrM
MSFTQNWFESLALVNFETLKNKININMPINFLEIGCFEGNCHKWMYENILIHPDSKSTVIDPFEKSLTHPDSYNKFCKNLEKYLNKITIHKGFSDDVLLKLDKNSYDIIYIDGDHSALAAYKDGVNSFPLLKNNGIMIFDDYLWVGTHPVHHVTSDYLIGGTNNPCKGVNQFYFEFKDKIKLMDEFLPKCDIIDIDRLYNDNIYRNNYSKNFNYQIFLTKL